MGRTWKVAASLGLCALMVSQSAAISSGVFSQSTSGGVSTLSFSYEAALETFVVPDNVSEITISLRGAQGGQGGDDLAPRPAMAGYRGLVTGTIPVTPGQLITVAVGGRGADGLGRSTGIRGFTGDSRVAVGGSNPIAGEYAGGSGGSSGYDGWSGYGGAGGAATVVSIGTVSDPDVAGTIVAGGAGASGGSGQFSSLIGGLGKSSHSARDDVSSTNGQAALYVSEACSLAPRPDNRCDGGGGAGGGGGAAGGARGVVEFGAGNHTEWYGLGGYPGANSNGGYSTLSTNYEYYTYSQASTKQHGSVTISFSTGVPNAPTGLSGTASNGGVELYWTAPSSVGVGPIEGYTVEIATSPFSSFTATSCSGTETTCSINGLSNGTAYKFRVKATNSAGDSAYSALTEELVPSGPPTAPTIDSLTRSDGSLSVAFSGATSSAPITDYEYSLDNGDNWISSGYITSPLVISGLTNGESYSIVLRTVNAIGSSTASSAATAIPFAVPGAPTITAVEAGNAGELVVTFVAGYEGGSPITDFEYSLSPGENTSDFGSYVSAGLTSPFTISGLNAGASYTVQLRAKSEAGVGPGSPFQSGVTLAIANAPVIVGVTPADSRLTVEYTPFDSSTNGGSAISDLQYSVDNGSTWLSAGTLATSFAISGLTNGVSYQVKLRAVNAIGTSDASLASTAAPATVPSAPRLVTVVSGVGSVLVSWSVPPSNGGLAIADYVASAFSVSTGGSVVQSCTTVNLSCTISSLDNGDTYFLEVIARNAAGNSPSSGTRISATPAALPGAPTISSITAGSQFLSVAFTAGTADSNAPVTGYQYSVDDGVNWFSRIGIQSPIVISSLVNGTSYDVKIRALSAVGSGAASNKLVAKPISTPDPVNSGTISYNAGNGSVNVSWTAPNDNGEAISSTVATAFSALVGGSSSGTCSTAGATVSCTISGLSNGVDYYVSIQTQNSVGFSNRSAPRVLVRPGGVSSSISLASSEASTIVGDSLTLTATVSSGATGTVSFTTDGVAITGCSAVTIVSDTATCTTTSLTAKTHTLRANYSGDASYASAASSALSLAVSSVFTTSFDLNGGSGNISPVSFTPGGSAITLPTGNRTSYVLSGWFPSAVGGSSVGAPGDQFTPSSTQTLYARWVQKSLYGMGTNTKIASITTASGQGNTYSVSRFGSSVSVEYEADALPSGTVIDFYMLSNTDRAEALLPEAANFVLNLVVAWLATDGTVPDTAPGKPLVMTINNSSIKEGAKIYSLLGNEVTLLGVAQADGVAAVEITEDPEIVVAVTKPDAPTGVVASASGSTATVTYSNAASGGSPVTSYVVTASTGQTCASATTTCTFTGLADGAIQFSVTATNSVGTSDASALSSVLTISAVGGGVVGGVGGGVGGGIVPPATTIPALPTPALDDQSPIIRSGESVAVELAGSNLNLITSVSLGELSLRFEVLSRNRILVSLPTSVPGILNIILRHQGGELEQDIKVQDISDKRLNAGSFNGVVALYAKGYIGQRFSAKVGKDWVIVDSLVHDYVRITERIRWIGHPIKVRIFIDRRLLATIDLVTK